jgi:hypothetical protein
MGKETRLSEAPEEAAAALRKVLEEGADAPSMRALVEHLTPVVQARVARALFYPSAGLVAGYAQAPSGDASHERIAFVGPELRPLFLPRLALDLEGMGPLLDLTFDSLSLGAGVCFPAEAGSDRNAALEFSMGLGIPLFLRANGLWLEARAALRPALSADSGQLFLLLSWYEAIETAIVR